MSWREEILGEGVRLINADCREILPALGKVDAVVTDPPYGIGEAGGKAKTRTSGLKHQYRRDYGDDSWDDEPVPPDLMAMVRRAADWQIIFGGNYYALPPTSCWLVWDKLNGDTDFADCELAWTNLHKAVRQIRFLWNGCMRMERDIAREHPTQKPVEVMRWCIGHLPPPCGENNRSLHGVRNDRCRGKDDGPQVRRHRAVAQILRHRLPAHRASLEAARHVH